MALTLPEEVLLLLLHDEKGKPIVDDTATGAALAGAAIVELTLDGALRLTDADEPRARKGRLVGTGEPPADPRLAPLVAQAEGRKPKDAVAKAAGWGWGDGGAKNLREGLLDDLAGQGLLSREKGKILGVFPTTTWPQGPRRQVEVELLQRVRGVVVDGLTPSPRTAALVVILHAVRTLPKLFPEQDKKALTRRGQQISESDWAGAAVRAAVQEVQAAMFAVIIATGAATTST